MSLEIGKRIKALRVAKGHSQQDIANRTGIKRVCLSRLENGRLPNPTINMLNRIAEGLDVPVAVLVSGDIPRLPDIISIAEEMKRSLIALGEHFQQSDVFRIGWLEKIITDTITQLEALVKS